MLHETRVSINRSVRANYEMGYFVAVAVES
jgi:hypothetical protein